MTIEDQLRELVREEVRRELAIRAPAAAGDQLHEYLTTKQVSEMVNLAVVTLEQMRARGRGPAFVRAGRRVLYRRSDVDAWLTSVPR